MRTVTFFSGRISERINPDVEIDYLLLIESSPIVKYEASAEKTESEGWKCISEGWTSKVVFANCCLQSAKALLSFHSQLCMFVFFFISFKILV